MDASARSTELPLRGMQRRTLCLGLACAAGAVRAQAKKAGWIFRLWPSDRKAPALELSELGGRLWSLAAHRGEVVLLNFWATWCEPCRAEMPALQAFALRHERDGLKVIAINFRESEATIRKFLLTTPLALPILLDSEGDAASEWTPKIFPSTVAIGRDGQPAFTVIGEADWMGDDIRALITPLLGSGTRASGAPARRASP